MSNVSGPAETTKAIEITVNGVPRQVPGDVTVLGLLEFLAVEPSRVAVERNRLIVRRPAWLETRIEQGDQVEIVQFVGGG